jgi:hypothetical protein
VVFHIVKRDVLAAAGVGSAQTGFIAGKQARRRKLVFLMVPSQGDAHRS